MATEMQHLMQALHPATRRAWPEAAVQFVLEGLALTVERVHGPTPSGWNFVIDWLRQNEYEIGDLAELHAARRLPRDVARIISELGGPAAFNRHVSGDELCDGLRVLAQQRWGRLACAVLGHWGIRSTEDIGRVVFCLIEAGRLTKQSRDRLSDFVNLFDFRQAFDDGHAIDLNAPPAPPRAPQEAEG
ncbi:MAG: Minf_1886 family protein [Phycisphaerae bacterium]